MFFGPAVSVLCRETAWVSPRWGSLLTEMGRCWEVWPGLLLLGAVLLLCCPGVLGHGSVASGKTGWGWGLGTLSFCTASILLISKCIAVSEPCLG